MAAKVTSYVAATGGGATECVVRAYPWVHQLAGAQRGAIHGSHDAIGSKVFAQAWGLDTTGNWSTFDDDPDGDGDWDLQQTRTASTRQTASSAVEPESLQPKYQYVWSPPYIDAPILRDENTDAGALCDDARLYYLADANFNVTALVDSLGAVVERYLYAPYGEVTVLALTFAEDADGLSDVSNVTLYTGRELDATTGLYYYRARYYDSAMGMFVGRDPIRYRAGVNLYQYVDNGLLNGADPSGLVNIKCCCRTIPRSIGQIGKTYSVVVNCSDGAVTKCYASACNDGYNSTWTGEWDLAITSPSPSYSIWDCCSRSQCQKGLYGVWFVVRGWLCALR